MLEIDGSIGEGGGQVLRTALSVACVKREKVRIYNIRAGRESGGLKAQHLSACRLLAAIANAKLDGAQLGSRRLYSNLAEFLAANTRLTSGQPARAPC